MDNDTKHVRALYEAHPYPSPNFKNDLINDVAIALKLIAPIDGFSGRTILDAGCGTGHRLVSTARAFPKAQFVGADMSRSSIDVARDLANRFEVTNVSFVVHDLQEPFSQQFDVAISTGVLHHLEDVERGIKVLTDAIVDDGFIFAWLYHEIGEQGRLVDRELARLFWRASGRSDQAFQLQLIEALGLSLSPDRYGPISRSDRDGDSHTSTLIDAFLNPIVCTYSIQEAAEIFFNASASWVSPFTLHVPGMSYRLDLSDNDSELPFALSPKELFPSSSVQNIYADLSLKSRIRAIELAIRPTGFTILAGKHNSFEALNPSIRNNLIIGSK